MALAVACGGRQQPGQLRFHNQPPVWQVNDRANVPQPADNDWLRSLYYVDQIVYEGPVKAMRVEDPTRALDINALGEVPDSTWFVNRVGVRDMTPEDVARGPNVGVPPGQARPWTVIGSKEAGAALGFRVRDANGVVYILKFDKRGRPELETGADVVVQRLLWALGYNVPEDHVVYFSRDDLAVGDGARRTLANGDKVALTEADLTRMLADVESTEDGQIRGLLSKFLSGVPIGGFPQLGVREDDPNDTIPHQHRRALRAMYLFFSWLQSTDMKTDNSLDMWVEDPRKPGHHYVMHYLVDFGMSLGVNGWRGNYGDGYLHNVDFGHIFPSILTLGLWKRPWEAMEDPEIRGVGVFDVEHYDPAHFKTRTPYFIFDYWDIRDMFWAAKTLMRLTPEHIQAAVEQGRYSDPRAVDYLTRTLVGRQRKAARYWFSRTNPLDRFRVLPVEGGGFGMCFADLLLAYDLERPGDSGETVYLGRTYDYAGARIGDDFGTRAFPGSDACVGPFELSPAKDGYTIVELATRRATRWLPPIFVHVARDPAGGDPRVIGIDRR